MRMKTQINQNVDPIGPDHLRYFFILNHVDTSPPRSLLAKLGRNRILAWHARITVHFKLFAVVMREERQHAVAHDMMPEIRRQIADAQLALRRSIVRMNANELTQRRGGYFIPIPSRLQQRLRVVRRVIMHRHDPRAPPRSGLRFQPNRPVKAGHRLPVIRPREPDVPKVHLNLRHIRPETRRLAYRGKCLIQLSAHVMREAQIAEDFRVVRLDLKSGLKCRGRLFVSPHITQKSAEQIVRPNQTRIQRNSVSARRYHLVISPQSRKRIPQIVIKIRNSRLHRDRALDQLLRHNRLAHLRRKNPQQIQRVRLIRIAHQNPCITLLRLLQPAAPMMLHRGPKRLHDVRLLAHDSSSSRSSRPSLLISALSALMIASAKSRLLCCSFSTFSSTVSLAINR